MIRFSFVFVVSTLLAAAVVFADSSTQITSPVTQLLIHDSLYTTLRTSTYRLYASAFSGKIDGKYEKVGGSATYTGTFKGTSLPVFTSVYFKFNSTGNVKNMGVHAMYKTVLHGNARVLGKGKATKVTVKASYYSTIKGTVKGKKLKGKLTARVNVIFGRGKIFAREVGDFRLYVGEELIVGSYYSTITGSAFKLSVYGTYGGEKFFIKYATSLNVLALGLDMNPMMVKRNYGTVTTTVNGNTTTESYDFEGMQMPQLN